MQSELALPSSPALSVGTRDPGALAVVVCLWNRPGRVTDVLRNVASQHGAGPLHLVLWNNNPEHFGSARTQVSAHGLSGALQSIDLFESRSNLLGMGRFVAIRALVNSGYLRSIAITLDDDQDVPPDFAATLAAEAGAQTVSGLWAFDIGETYWSRTQLSDPGASANYVGTGGAAWPVALVEEDAFFTSIPLRFRMIEDLWASFQARAKGWRLIRSATEATFVMQEQDQGHALHRHKTQFYRVLT